MAAAGITNVRTWSADSWVGDLGPPLVCGWATAATVDAIAA